MKVLYISLCFAILLVATSCKKAPSTPEKVTLDNIPVYNLEMDTLIVYTHPHFHPSVELINDSTLFLIYPDDPGNIGILNVNNRKINSILIRKESSRIQLSEDPDFSGDIKIWHKGNRYYYEFTAEKGVLRISDYQSLRIGIKYPLHKALKLDNDLFVSLGGYSKGLFRTLNTDTRKTKFYGTYPLNEPKFYNRRFVDAFIGDIDVKDNRVVYVSKNFGYISTYDYKKGKLVKRWEKQLTDFIYKTGINKIEIDPDNCYGFDQVRIINDHIYGLYAGYSDNSNNEFRNSLLVFDQDGNPLARYYFPFVMDNFVVDEKEEYIYTSHTPFMNEVCIGRYKIPEMP